MAVNLVFSLLHSYGPNDLPTLARLLIASSAVPIAWKLIGALHQPNTYTTATIQRAIHASTAMSTTAE